MRNLDSKWRKQQLKGCECSEQRHMMTKQHVSGRQFGKCLFASVYINSLLTNIFYSSQCSSEEEDEEKKMQKKIEK